MPWIKRFAFVALFCPTALWSEGLTVFAASSLKEPLDQIIAQWPGAKVSYGGSGTLARQIQKGAPADVVLLANTAWMEVLQDNGDVDAMVPFAGNTLILIGQPGGADVSLTPDGLSDALGDGRLAIGFTSAVPAGIYGRQALSHLDLWETVQPRLAEVDNVRAALALAARGEVPLAVVYASDAEVVPDLPILARFPIQSHDPIVYWAAKVAGSNNPFAADFVSELTGKTSQDAFADAGFCPLDGCSAQ